MSDLAQAPQITKRSLTTGETIFHEGEPGDNAYIVQSGQVEIIKNGKILGTIKKGGIFGEMALIDNAKRMAGARTVGDTELAVISRDVFNLKMSRTDPFVSGIMKVFVRNIRSMAVSVTRDT